MSSYVHPHQQLIAVTGLWQLVYILTAMEYSNVKPDYNVSCPHDGFAASPLLAQYILTHLRTLPCPLDALAPAAPRRL
jgi:hypothetical protein